MLDVSSLPDFDTKYINGGQVVSYYADDYSTTPVTINSHKSNNFQSMEVFLSSLLPAKYNGYFKAFYLNDMLIIRGFLRSVAANFTYSSYLFLS